MVARKATASESYPTTIRPPTLSFRLEEDLVNMALNSIRETTDYRVVTEFDSMHGIADLVLYRPYNCWENRSDLQHIPSNWAFALRTLPYRRYFSINDFAALTCAPPSKAICILRNFETAGFLRYSRLEKLWIKIRQPQAPIKEIIAIEAKLTKWRDALRQANRYRHFSHASWVVMNRATSSAAIKNIETFKRFGIGLAVVDMDGNMDIHYNPGLSEPKSPMLYWRANVLLVRNLAG